jgi:hypothetical protein
MNASSWYLAKHSNNFTFIFKFMRIKLAGIVVCMGKCKMRTIFQSGNPKKETAWEMYVCMEGFLFHLSHYKLLEKGYAPCNESVKLNSHCNGKVKCKVIPPPYEGVLGERRYISTHSLTSALDGKESNKSKFHLR